ncbi:unnamed protein product [Cylicocyclus nassatus]|uniref:Fucosyltransferase n=1 Tax=Cylicocyclus nassatus TaxID=53992 RepID=A0AA36DKG8_CYLNA|nr:unnamed protein product [Cylicocyclus nassatus]
MGDTTRTGWIGITLLLSKGYFLRQNKIRRTAFFVLILLSILATLLCQSEQNTWAASAVDHATYNNTAPLIVTWTAYPAHCDREAELLMPAAKSCLYQCEFVDREGQKLHSRKASAYLIHGLSINFFDLPKQSTEHLIILLMRESPLELEKWSDDRIYRVPKNYFNATMTYRKESRYFYAYGQFEMRTANDAVESVITQDQLLTSLKKKTNGSLLFISICNSASKREQKIRELRKFTEITTRGRCEKKLAINGSATNSECKSNCKDHELIATHRFYIAFENSNCDGYITGKFYHRISQLLVPVVLKRRIYEDAGIPPTSFIAADDFDSLEDLGKHLNYLRKNDTAYLRYFEWTKRYRKPDVYETNAMCKLCEDIYKGNRMIVDDIKKHFSKDQCI